MTKKKDGLGALDQVAGNGLMSRRLLLGRGAAMAGAMTIANSAGAEPLKDDEWGRSQGITSKEADPRSRFEDKVKRTLSNPNGEPRTQHARTPHHLLNGTVTPNHLHFTIVHTGAPDIDPAQHRLVLHGLVKQPLVFTLDKLARYPMESRMAFVECGGNSGANSGPNPAPLTAGGIHGLLSCSEWTGIRLSTLLDEAGVAPKGKWLLVESGDAANLSRSNLRACNLAGANLYDANLSRADLPGANLSGANLFVANLSHADLTDTTLTGANFTGANLDRANRANEDVTASNRWRLVCLADLEGAAGLETVQRLAG